MTTDFRALCSELHAALENRCETLEEDRLLDRSAAALRAAMAEPEPPRRNFVGGYQPRPSIGTHNPPPKNP